MKTNLPTYWVVDITNDTNNEVINYLNKLHKYFDYSLLGYSKYFGFDGTTIYNGVCFGDNIDKFENNPTLLTLEEFRELSKPIEEFVEGEEVEISNNGIDWEKRIFLYYRKSGKYRYMCVQSIYKERFLNNEDYNFDFSMHCRKPIKETMEVLGKTYYKEDVERVINNLKEI